LKLAINVGLLLLEVGRSVDLSGGRHDGEREMGGGIIWVSLKEKKENEALQV
jgi:hypothetical protein